jgi:uncharacterized protein (TIGR02145 family)
MIFLYLNNYKKSNLIFTAFLACAFFFTGCKEEIKEPTENPLTYDKGVVINGVTWATRNVDKPGTFTAAPEDAGMLYQWNRKVGWSITDPTVNSNGSTVWDSSTPTGEVWTDANNPCPKGWRLPTKAELQKIIDADYTWTTLNGMPGVNFNKTPNTTFLPVNGAIDGDSNGKILQDIAVYWSSDFIEGEVNYLLCRSMDSVVTLWKYSLKDFASNIRCVKE